MIPQDLVGEIIYGSAAACKVKTSEIKNQPHISLLQNISQYAEDYTEYTAIWDTLTLCTWVRTSPNGKYGMSDHRGILVKIAPY